MDEVINPKFIQKFTTTNLSKKKKSLKMDMFDIDYTPLTDSKYLTQTKEEFSLAGFNVIIK